MIAVSAPHSAPDEPHPAASSDRFAVEGFLLAGPEGALRLLVGDVYLDFRQEDLVELDVLPGPDDLRREAAVRIRVALRRGCRLDAVGDGRSLREQLWNRPSPFAFASRAGDPVRLHPDSFLERERAYVAELDAFEGSLP